MRLHVTSVRQSPPHKTNNKTREREGRGGKGGRDKEVTEM